MSPTPIEFPLGKHGLVYVREVLSEGGLPSELFLQSNDVAAGEAAAIAPRSATAEDVRQLNGCFIDCSGAEEYVIRQIMMHCAAPGNGIVLIEDEHLNHDGGHAQGTYDIGGELIHVVSREADYERIRRTLVTSFTVHARVFFGPGEYRWSENDDVNIETLRRIVRGTRAVVVSAYDQAGFVIWRRRSLTRELPASSGRYGC